MVYGIAFEGGHDAYRLLVHKQGITPNDHMDRGTRFEEPIMGWGADVMGWEYRKAATVRWEKNGVLYRDTADYFARPIGKGEDSEFLCEVKSHGHFMEKFYGTDSSSQVPPRVHVQCQMHCYANNVDYCRVIAHFGSTRPRVFQVNFDPELWAMLEEKVEHFWNSYVLAKTPPPADDSESCGDMLKHIQQQDDVLVTASEEIITVDAELQAVNDRLRVDKMRKEYLQNTIRENIGGHVGVQGPGWKYTTSDGKSKAKVNNKALVAELGMLHPDLLAKHTTTTQGGRRLTRKDTSND
jgi:hypothetical protein